jgi:hypothetical protein
VVKAGLGFAAAKQRLTIGADFYRNMEVTRTEDGIAGASFTWNPDKKHGFAIMGRAEMALNSTAPAGTSTKDAVVGLGYSFNPNAAFEAFVKLNDFSDTSNIGLGGAFTFTGHMFYLAGRFDYDKKTAYSLMSGRAGLIFGQIDVSGYVAYYLISGSTPGFGGSFRFAF